MLLLSMTHGFIYEFWASCGALILKCFSGLFDHIYNNIDVIIAVNLTIMVRKCLLVSEHCCLGGKNKDCITYKYFNSNLLLQSYLHFTALFYYMHINCHKKAIENVILICYEMLLSTYICSLMLSCLVLIEHIMRNIFKLLIIMY